MLQIIQAAETPRTVRLVGEVDLSNAEELHQALRALTSRDGSASADGSGSGTSDEGDLIVDIAGLGFIDSMGVRVLLSAAEALRGRGQLVLRSPTSPVARVFAVLGLDNRGNITIEEA